MRSLTRKAKKSSKLRRKLTKKPTVMKLSRRKQNFPYFLSSAKQKLRSSLRS